MDEVLIAKIGSMLILGGFSLVLGLLPIKIIEKFGLSKLDAKGKNTKAQLALSALNCFGAGVILTTSFTHMLPEVREILEATETSG